MEFKKASVFSRIAVYMFVDSTRAQSTQFHIYL